MEKTPNIQEIEKFLYSTYQDKKEKHVKQIEPDKGVSFNTDFDKFRILSLILPFGLDSVIAKPSKIHGTGVFAKRNIMKNELITFYPADFIEYSPDKNRHIPGHRVAIFRSARLEKVFGAIFNKEVRDNDYAYYIDQTYTIIGEKKFDNDPNYLGHLINDGAKSNSSEKSDKIYAMISLLKGNCKYYNLKGGLHVAIIATNDIKKGKELFIPYGIPYWSSYNKNKGTKNNSQ